MISAWADEFDAHMAPILAEARRKKALEDLAKSGDWIDTYLVALVRAFDMQHFGNPPIPHKVRFTASK